MKNLGKLSALVAAVLLSRDVRGDLVLQIDQSGNALLRNTGSTAINFDGYTIHCELASGDGCAEPTIWLSLEDQITADAVAVLGRLGAGGLGFAEASPNEKQLSEITLGSGGILQPSDEVSLGQPFKSTVNYASSIGKQRASLGMDICNARDNDQRTSFGSARTVCWASSNHCVGFVLRPKVSVHLLP